MSDKQEQKEQPQQPEQKPETTRQKGSYFFPNGGNVPAHSVMAHDLEEAEKLNDDFVKEQK